MESDFTHVVKRVPNGYFDDVKAMMGVPPKWQAFEALPIAQYRWVPPTAYQPESYAYIAYSDKGLHLYMLSYETEITVNHFDMQGKMYEDSCLEIFICPVPQWSDKYINVEINPVGAVRMGFGLSRYDRSAPDIPLAEMNLSTVVTKENKDRYRGPCWSLSYTLPFSLFERLYGVKPNPGDTMRANFQKCGDKCKEAHFGTWNPIRLSNPDFHRPEFFGYLVLER